MRAPSDHVCPLCETTCDSAVALRAEVRTLQRTVLELAIAFKQERAFWQMAFSELEAHQREEQVA